MIGLFFRRGGVLTAAAAVGLTAARWVNELVPDSLGIGVCMFCAGALGGVVIGFSWRTRAERLVGRGSQ